MASIIAVDANFTFWTNAQKGNLGELATLIWKATKKPVREEEHVQIKDLEVFRDVPFLCWVKDEEWRYLWGNRVICDLAGEIY
jgi:hypothetical protein